MKDIDHNDCRQLIEDVELFLNEEDNEIKSIKEQSTDLEKQLADPDIWSRPTKAGQLNKELTAYKLRLSRFEDLSLGINNLKAALELDDKNEEESIYFRLHKNFKDLQNEQFLNGKFDKQDAQLSIHAGAGGIDAQDWAAMLCAMYQSFSTKQDWNWEIVHISAGEEGGLKSATLNIRGINTYGYLKEEAGVHRLVRISPFNSGKTRETSFALVEVLPMSVHDSVKIAEIQEKDLKWEYSMSSGKGGQSVNTTYSAVRLVHLPTGLSVTCQNERSQLQNKHQALKYLKNKLAVLEIKKNQELQNEIKGHFVSAQWGSQIRSYTLHPYKLLKDHRSGFESSDVEKILEEGDLLPVIWSVKTH
ncbi:MAG: peptide chain release factor 2 [Patescibacteria group bacterium]